MPHSQPEHDSVIKIESDIMYFRSLILDLNDFKILLQISEEVFKLPCIPTFLICLGFSNVKLKSLVSGDNLVAIACLHKAMSLLSSS